MSVVEVIKALAAAPAELSAAGDRLHHLVKRLADRPDLVVDLLEIDLDLLPAAGAFEARVAAKASERALRLMTALRAGQAHLLVVETELAHLLALPVRGAAPSHESMPPRKVRP